MKLALVAILMLLNLHLWPQWIGLDGWVVFFAVLCVVGGVVLTIILTC